MALILPSHNKIHDTHTHTHTDIHTNINRLFDFICLLEKKATAGFSTSVLKMAHPMPYSQAGWGPSSPYSAHINSGYVPPGATQHSMHWQDFHTEPVQSPGNMQYVPLPYHVMVPVGESGMMPFVQTQFYGYQGYPLHMNRAEARQVSKLKLIPLKLNSFLYQRRH